MIESDPFSDAEQRRIRTELVQGSESMPVGDRVAA